MKTPKFSIKEVGARIFCLTFKRHYDLCMFFLRYQEHYESPNPRFRKKSFELLEFMDWYAHKFGKGSFTYPVDWGGFNIPSHVIPALHVPGIKDRNIYDHEMWNLYKSFLEKYPDGQFYIIGVSGKYGKEFQSQSIRHEIAHGMFYTNASYRKEMTKLVRALKPKFYKAMCSNLKKIGYCSAVYVDECQAYLSTGVPEKFTDIKLTGQEKPFQNLYYFYAGDL